MTPKTLRKIATEIMCPVACGDTVFPTPDTPQSVTNLYIDRIVAAFSADREWMQKRIDDLEAAIDVALDVMRKSVHLDYEVGDCMGRECTCLICTQVKAALRSGKETP